MNSLIFYLCSSVALLGLSNKQEKRACAYIPSIIKEAEKQNIDPALLTGLIFVESSFNPWVVSSAGACGLTQVIPKYTGKYSPVKKYTCEQLKNPYTSIAAGAKILRWWIDYHDGNVSRALCGYSSGFRCKGKKPLRAGMIYSKKVLKTTKTIKIFPRK